MVALELLVRQATAPKAAPVVAEAALRTQEQVEQVGLAEPSEVEVAEGVVVLM